MGYKIVIEIMGLPPMANELFAMHWKERMRSNNKWKRDVGMAVLQLGKPPVPLQKAEIILTRYSSKQPDPDNMATGFKACMDGLKEIGVIIDDHPDVIGAPKYVWENSKKGKGRITIEVREV